MQDTVWQGIVMPGPAIFDEEAAYAFLAVVNGLLGDGEAAEPHAHKSLELLAGTGQYTQIGGTHNALCRAYLRRAKPDPERAADAARNAFAVLDGRPSRSVVQTAAQFHREMRHRWPELPAVRDLDEMVRATRRALPPESV
jgi:hypothetical protein